jgi:hypothetical protein
METAGIGQILCTRDASLLTNNPQLENSERSSMPSNRDKSLGMDQPIARRDFLQGAAVGTAAALAGLTPAKAAQESEPQNAPNYYPSTRLGLRGSHPGSF